MRKLQFSMVIILVIVISGCSNAKLELTTKEINNINSISVHKPKISKDLKLAIEASVKNPALQQGLAPTGSLELMLIGGLIDNAMHSHKQKKFEVKYKDELSKIREYKVENVEKRIESIMISLLKKDNFLNKKVFNYSSTYFDSEINSFGLEKTLTDKDKEVYLNAKIALKVSLIGNDGKRLMDDVNLITYSKDSYSVTELSNDNTLVGKLFESAYENFETLFTFHLNRTFKNKDLQL